MKHYVLQLTIVLAFTAYLLSSPLIAQNPDPRDFAIPEQAFQDFSICQFAGALVVKSKSFTAWQSKTGEFGELVALFDKRNFKHATDTASEEFDLLVDEADQEVDPRGLSSFPDNRVCDIAYQLICRKYDAKPISYRCNLKRRDELIAKLVVRIQNPADRQPTSLPDHKKADNK